MNLIDRNSCIWLKFRCRINELGRSMFSYSDHKLRPTCVSLFEATSTIANETRDLETFLRNANERRLFSIGQTAATLRSLIATGGRIDVSWRQGSLQTRSQRHCSTCGGSWRAGCCAVHGSRHGGCPSYAFATPRCLQIHRGVRGTVRASRKSPALAWAWRQGKQTIRYFENSESKVFSSMKTFDAFQCKRKCCERHWVFHWEYFRVIIPSCFPTISLLVNYKLLSSWKWINLLTIWFWIICLFPVSVGNKWVYFEPAVENLIIDTSLE